MINFSNKKRILAIQEIDFLEHNPIQKEQLKRLYMDVNTINLDFDTPIYRIYHYDRLLETLKTKKLCLVKPKLWDDPFENFLLKSTGILVDGTKVSFEPIRELLYGQCWSLKEECDGLWRNYTNYSCNSCSFCNWVHRHHNNCPSVKVQTTVGKLMDSFYDMTNPFHSLCYFITKVEYVDDGQIADILKNAAIKIMDSTCLGGIKSLSVKRKAFEYEQEVRLIFNKPSDQSEVDLTSIANPWDNSDVFKFSIDPNSLFDKVILNPWMDSDLQNDIIGEIKKYFNGEIVKSSLYEQPFFQVKI